MRAGSSGTPLIDMLIDADQEKAGRAMQAMLKMGKLDVAALQKAYDGAEDLLHAVSGPCDGIPWIFIEAALCHARF
jgi:hypothetical protein